MIYDNITWYMSSNGYWTNNIHGLLHRYIYEQYNGPIPEGYVVHHINSKKTDNAPENLIAMTQGDHASLHHIGEHHSEETKKKISKSAKGHIVSDETREKISKVNKGEKHPQAKLTELDVKWIRMWLSLGYTQLSIADAFKVGQSQISRIKTGKTRSTAC